MTPKRVYYLMIAATSLCGLAIIIGTVLASRVLHQQSDKLVASKLDNRIVDEQQTALNQAKKNLDQYKSLGSIATTIVPQDKDQAKAVREIVNLSNQSGVKLSTITFPASTLGQAAPKTDPSSDQNSTSATPTSPVTQVKPVPGISGLYSLEVTIQQDTTAPTTYPKLIDFLSKLENNRRTAQVTNVSITPSPTDRSKLTFSLIVSTYIKP